VKETLVEEATCLNGEKDKEKEEDVHFANPDCRVGGGFRFFTQ